MSLKRKITDIPSDRPVSYDTSYDIVCVNCYHFGFPCNNCKEYTFLRLKEINISWETFKKYSKYKDQKITYEDYVRIYGDDYYDKNKKKQKN